MSRNVELFLRMILVLVFVYLVVRNWQGATALVRQTGSSTTGLVKTLQGR